jgi:biopolymer transport protein ExbD
VPEIRRRLIQAHRSNPKLAVNIRADRGSPFGEVFTVTDLCANLGLEVAFKSLPPK